MDEENKVSITPEVLAAIKSVQLRTNELNKTDVNHITLNKELQGPSMPTA